MSIRDILHAALEHAEGTPTYDVLMLLLLRNLELGKGNDGLMYTHIRDARDTLTALLQDINVEIPCHERVA